jgi:hypothetical protein
MAYTGRFRDLGAVPGDAIQRRCERLHEASSQARVDQQSQNPDIRIAADPVEASAHSALTKQQDTTRALFFLGWRQDHADPQDRSTAVFHSRSTIRHTGRKNAEYDWVREKADVEQNPSRRGAVCKRAARILVEEAPVAFLFHAVVSRVVRPYVRGLLQKSLDYFGGRSAPIDLKASIERSVSLAATPVVACAEVMVPAPQPLSLCAVHKSRAPTSDVLHVVAGLLASLCSLARRRHCGGASDAAGAVTAMDAAEFVRGAVSRWC